MRFTNVQVNTFVLANLDKLSPLPSLFTGLVNSELGGVSPINAKLLQCSACITPSCKGVEIHEATISREKLSSSILVQGPVCEEDRVRVHLAIEPSFVEKLVMSISPGQWQYTRSDASLGRNLQGVLGLLQPNMELFTQAFRCKTKVPLR